MKLRSIELAIVIPNEDKTIEKQIDTYNVWCFLIKHLCDGKTNGKDHAICVVVVVLINENRKACKSNWQLCYRLI